MKTMLFISAVLLFLCVSSFGMAFDNHRHGFIIGGLGGIAVNFFWDTDGSVVFIPFLHTDFRIGWGFKGDKVMLYYWNPTNLFDFIIGPGVSYYFKPNSPSHYINAGIVGYMQGFFEAGFGVMGGIGYEYARHWSVECGVMWGVTDFDYNRLTISLSIIGIAY